MPLNIAQIRGRIDELKLSRSGFSRQLDRLDLTAERSARLRTELLMLADEIAALEKIAQVARVEPDSQRIEQIIRDRISVLIARLRDDPATADVPPEQHEYASGELKALLWSLGEDNLSRSMRAISGPRTPLDTARSNLAARRMLLETLRDSTDDETRAGAAYELGQLGAEDTIPALAEAAGGGPLLSEVAVRALGKFSDSQLQAAGVSEPLLSAVRDARPVR